MGSELCCECEEPTGRAGRSEDSLYADDLGPYCEGCWGDVPYAQAEELATLRAELAAERERREAAERERADAVDAAGRWNVDLLQARQERDNAIGERDEARRLDNFLRHHADYYRKRGNDQWDRAEAATALLRRWDDAASSVLRKVDTLPPSLRQVSIDTAGFLAASAAPEGECEHLVLQLDAVYGVMRCRDCGLREPEVYKSKDAQRARGGE